MSFSSKDGYESYMPDQERHSHRAVLEGSDVVQRPAWATGTHVNAVGDLAWSAVAGPVLTVSGGGIDLHGRDSAWLVTPFPPYVGAS